MEQDIKRVSIKWKAGEDPMTEGDITVEDITIGRSTEEQLIEQLRLTREALRKYGKHTLRCEQLGSCMCGFTEAMEALK